MLQANLSTLSDEEIIEEAARRLQRRFKKKTGTDFDFGHIEFVFHEGVFVYTEDYLRRRNYLPSQQGKGRRKRFA